MNAEDSTHWPFMPPLKFDPDLWYEALCDRHAKEPTKHYIIGNPHTFPGRMYAWCPERDSLIYVSKAEMDTISPKLEIWLDGFLAGNEPDYPIDDLDNNPEHTKGLIEFRETGYWHD